MVDCSSYQKMNPESFFPDCDEEDKIDEVAEDEAANDDDEELDAPPDPRSTYAPTPAATMTAPVTPYFRKRLLEPEVANVPHRNGITIYA